MLAKVKINNIYLYYFYNNCNITESSVISKLQFFLPFEEDVYSFMITD